MLANLFRFSVITSITQLTNSAVGCFNFLMGKLHLFIFGCSSWHQNLFVFDRNRLHLLCFYILLLYFSVVYFTLKLSIFPLLNSFFIFYFCVIFYLYLIFFVVLIFLFLYIIVATGNFRFSLIKLIVGVL